MRNRVDAAALVMGAGTLVLLVVVVVAWAIA